MQPAASNPTLSAGDWGVILLYLVGVIGLGLWLGRGQRNTRDYFLGGRNLPWWGVALSILATETSALTFIGVPAMAYGGNLGFMQIVLGYALGRVLLAVVVVPYYFKNEIYSPYALLGQAFGMWAVLEFGPSLFPVTKKAIQANPTLAWQMVVATPVFAAFASFIPAMLAVSHDPAETLRED